MQDTRHNADAPAWLAELAAKPEKPAWLAELAALPDDLPVPAWLAAKAKEPEPTSGNPWDNENWGLIANRVQKARAVADVQARRQARASMKQIKNMLILDCKIATGSEQHYVASARAIVASGLADIVGTIESVVPASRESSEVANHSRKPVAYANGSPVMHWASAIVDDSDKFVVISYDANCGNYDVVIQSRTGGEIELSTLDCRAIGYKLGHLLG